METHLKVFSELLTALNFNYNLSGDAILKLHKVKSKKIRDQVMEISGCPTMEHYS